MLHSKFSETNYIMSTNLNYSFGSITQLGKQKDFNTDSIIEFSIHDGHVFVVCDGHDGDGGHGALAAKLTSDSIKKYFHNRSYKDINIALTNAVTYANYVVYEQSTKDEKYRNIGSTLAILIYHKNKAHFAYAGDSRIYLHKDEKLKALTLDHVVDRYNPAGSEVNVIIGRNKDIKFGVCKTPIELNENDKFLLCSDGLTDFVTNEEIGTIISNKDTSPDHKTLLLAKKADENDGTDNASIHIVEFDNNHPVPKNKITIDKNFKLILIALFSIIIVGFGGFKGYQYLVKENANKKTEKTETVNTKELDPKQTAVEKKKKNTPEIKPITKKTEEIKAETKPTPVKKEPSAKSEANKPTYYTHKIKFGENLYRIAIRYGVTQKKLIQINGDKAKKLIAGSSLKIPVLAIHIVKKGESYSVISDKYNIKIDAICRTNKITKTQALSEGKKIIIPRK